MKNRIITLIVGIVLIPLLTPMLFRKVDVLMTDVERMFQNKRTPIKGIFGLIYLLIHNKYFRNIYYDRMHLKSVVLRLIYPPSETFVLGKNIGPGLYAAHPFATIINVKKAGKNLSVRNNTTIGNKASGRNDLCPTIGDNVTIGANVCIIGDINIGNNVTVGAGCVVVKNIPDNAIVVGNPSRIIGYNINDQQY